MHDNGLRALSEAAKDEVVGESSANHTLGLLPACPGHSPTVSGDVGLLVTIWP